MRKKTTKQQPKLQKPADRLLKTSKKKDIELTEQELERVSGGFGDIKGEGTDRPHKDWI